MADEQRDTQTNVLDGPIYVTLDSGETFTLPDQLEDLKAKDPKTGAAFEVVYSTRKNVDTVTAGIRQLSDIFTTAANYSPRSIFKFGGPVIRALTAIKNTIEAEPALKEELFKDGQNDDVRKVIESIDELQSLAELSDLLPYIDDELKRPEYNVIPKKILDEIEDPSNKDDIRFAAVLANSFDEAGKLMDNSLFVKAINEAVKTAKKNADAQTTGTFKTTIKRADIIEYPLDKVNSEIWNLLAEQNTGKQIAFKAERTGSKKELTIYYSIDFDNLAPDITITKQLTPFDKRAYIAVSALFNAGNPFVTLTQIHYAMGNDKRPSGKQLQKIYNSIRKMNGALVHVDNTIEAAEYTNYPVFKYSGSLLPIEDIQAYINGQLTDAAIHLFREPPIITFAKERNQITTVNVALLNSPVNKTDENIAIDDYLIERIARAKNGKQPCKILFKTLYEKTNITTSKQKSRAREKVERFLKHYRTQGFISDYKIETDKIIVSFHRS